MPGTVQIQSRAGTGAGTGTAANISFLSQQFGIEMNQLNVKTTEE